MADGTTRPAQAAAPAAPEPPPSVEPRRVSGETVTVACKLPGGLILRVYDMEDYPEPVMGGGVKLAQRAVKVDDEYRLNGAAVDLRRVLRGNGPAHHIVGGYALTPGIPKDFWDRWLNDNRNSDLVRNGLIFAQRNDMSAMSQAQEQAELPSGLEPIDPDKPQRIDRRIQRATPGAA